jgi:hypothetical protein
MIKKTYPPLDMKLRPKAIFLTVLLWVNLAQAQESANASGGDATGSGGTVAYSIGQVIYTAHTGTNGSVAQGVQHAYEIFTLGINETELNISLSVFPNPTSDNLILQVNDFDLSTLNFQLTDMQGKLLNNEKVTAQQTQISTAILPPATYFIHVVTEENKNVQSFKIIKN